jgi:two-component system heavy metal sensor histidine kinase CusS
VAWAWVGGTPGGYTVIQAAVDDTRDENLQRLWLFVLAISLIVAGIVSWGLATQVTHRGMRPLYAILETTRRVQSSALTERVPSEGMPTELAQLAADFNHMLDRLEESFLRQSQFSANVAHELRTPLNILRGQIEVALRLESSADDCRNVLVSNLEECVRLSGIVDGLLFVARLEGSEATMREDCNLMPELEKVLAYYEPVAADKGVSLRLEPGGGMWANLDRVLARRAAANLVSNALAATPPGGGVVVCAVRHESEVWVEVRDTGAGIAPEHIPHLFDRFYRADPSRSSKLGGVGLGLSIVKTIMDLHGGSVNIESELGHGTCARLVFQSAAVHGGAESHASTRSRIAYDCRI